MSDESSSAQPVAASASPPSVPPAPVDPSPGVRVTQQIRELCTDLGGLALAAYLVQRGAITGTHALMFALALLLPSPLLLRLAKVLGARGSAGAGVAVALLGASAAWAKIKGVAVLGVAAVGLAACLGGCAAGQTPVLSPIAPRVVHDALYGTCVEVGGKLTVGELAIAQLSRTCVLLDGGASALDAGLDLDEPLPADVPDKTDAGVGDE